MATDLDVTTAAWGSANLLLASGDDISGATGYGWGSQVAQNTGWLYYQPRPLHALKCPAIGATRDATYGLGYVYLVAGTYSIYGYCKTDAPDAPVGTMRFDGTNLVTFTGTVVGTGALCGWPVATAGWFAIAVTGSANSVSTTITTATALRFGSYAP